MYKKEIDKMVDLIKRDLSKRKIRSRVKHSRTSSSAYIKTSLQQEIIVRISDHFSYNKIPVNIIFNNDKLIYKHDDLTEEYGLSDIPYIVHEIVLKMYYDSRC